jgi:hypothetical protein
MREPIDAETHELATKVITESRRRGVDPVEALHQAGLLATPTGDRLLRVSVVEDILTHLNKLRVADFMRRNYRGSLNQRTPQDLYDSIVDWLGDYVTEMRKP